MSQGQDCTLSEFDAENLKNHLFACLSCRNFKDQLGFLSRLARRYGGDGVPPEDAPL